MGKASAPVAYTRLYRRRRLLKDLSSIFRVNYVLYQMLTVDNYRTTEN